MATSMFGIFILFLFQFAACFRDNNWDVLIFTQRWPNSACLQYEESGPNRFCALPPKGSTWTVHGVWPTKLQTIGPSFCNESLKFDPGRLMPIREKLLITWPNLEGGKDTQSLWKHEWLKHGTCAVSLDTLKTEELYFAQGLKWFQMYNMTGILSESRIIPVDGRGYDLSLINGAIVNKLGVRPHIACVTEKYSKNPYLFELRICFDKSFKLVDCDGTLFMRKILGNCPPGIPIRYPRSLPPLPTPPSFRDLSLVKTLTRIIQILDWL